MKTPDQEAYGFTTFCGLSAKKAFALSTAKAISRARASFVAQEMCGVTRQFFAFNNGLLAGGGSADRTSTPAPASRPALRASAKSWSTINGPRELFRRNAVGFIKASR